MTDFGPIRVARVDRIARAILHWQTPLGSIDVSLLDHFAKFIEWLEDEKPCDVLVFHAVGYLLDSEAHAPNLDQCRRWEKLLVQVDRLPCISVAAVDGPCTRLWLQLALACDHRVVTTRSSFQVLELKEGYLPGMNIFRLAKYIGIGPARRLSFTGAPLDPAEATTLGIVDDLCEPSDLEGALQAFMRRLEPIHPIAVQLARRLLNESFSTAFEQFLGQYLAAQQRCFSGGSHGHIIESR